MDRWLVSLDTDHVKGYVFATGRLREIRGASALLDHLNRDETERLIAAHGGEKIYTGGGSAMATFDDINQANAFRAAVETLYPQQTHTATITGIDPLGYDTGDDFGDTVRAAARQLRRQKDAGRRPPPLLNGTWWSRCRRCGQYPAVERAQLPDEADAGLCVACVAKCRASRNMTLGPAAQLVDAYPQWTGLQVPDELGKLGERSRPANYVGYIYADGNGIGAIIETFRREADLKTFSDILRQSILAAIDQAAGPIIANGHSSLPLVPVLIGGDDIILIAPAHVALPLAAEMCLAFQREVARRSREMKAEGFRFDGEQLDVAMSAGVALAKSSHPIFALSELAGELLAEAKALSSQLLKNHGRQSTLNFRVISSATANPWPRVRREELLLSGSGDRTRWATSRPYPCAPVEGLSRPSWHDIEKSVALLRASRFPGNKLHVWRDMLRAEDTQATEIEIELLMSRLSANHQDTLKTIFTEHLYLTNPHDPLFLRNPLDTGELLTPLPDLVEIYDFLP